MKKSLTLTELIISAVLIGVFVLAVFGLFKTISDFYTSSDLKSVLLGELNFLIEHIDRHVYKATGYVENPALEMSPDPPHIIDINVFDSDTGEIISHSYQFDDYRNRIRFRSDPDGDWETLTKRLSGIDLDIESGVLVINELTLRYRPEDDPDPRKNPEITITGQKFTTLMQSIN